MRLPFRHALPAVLLALLLLAGLTPFGTPAPVAAGTAETMEAAVAQLLNTDRTARGLRPLRIDARLADLAGDRAAIMASKNQMTHSAAGDLGSQLKSRGIQNYAHGEVIGTSTATWGTTSATRIYAAWKASAPHWKILMSSRYNYVGIGFAYRPSGAKTFGSIVVTESLDRTAAWARMTGVSRKSNTVTWTWTGGDVLLQTHTAGLRGFDVQYKHADSGWYHLASNTTARSWTMARRAHGMYHYLRIRARDWRGNTSAWTSALRIWVP